MSSRQEKWNPRRLIANVRNRLPVFHRRPELGDQELNILFYATSLDLMTKMQEGGFRIVDDPAIRYFVVVGDRQADNDYNVVLLHYPQRPRFPESAQLRVYDSNLTSFQTRIFSALFSYEIGQQLTSPLDFMLRPSSFSRVKFNFELFYRRLEQEEMVRAEKEDFLLSLLQSEVDTTRTKQEFLRFQELGREVSWITPKDSELVPSSLDSR